MSDRYQLCPVCRGHGVVSYPAYVTADQPSYVSSSTGPWPCRRCGGTGTLDTWPIAAVRTQAFADVRRVVEEMQGWAPNVDGRSMVTVVHGEWLPRAEVLDALSSEGT